MKRPLSMRIQIALMDAWQRIHHGKDSCQFCLGAKKGMPGNENVFHGLGGRKVLACDNCSSLVDDIIKQREE